jgi:1,4-dihydroxy-2-naphthoyl-CoA hydrolase
MAVSSATEFIRDSMPFCGTLGVSAASLAPERVVLELAWRAELCTSNGLLHGGVLMAVADAAGGACAFLNLPDGAAGTSTIESKTNFLGAVREGTVVATASPLHVGGSTIVVETELRVAGKLVGKTTQTQTVLRP